MLRFAIAAFILQSTSVSFAEAPSPGSVSIRDLSYRGTGCAAGSVAANISPDNKAMTLLFDDFIVATDGARRATKNCQIDVDLDVPQGWSYALFCVDFRGFADLEANTSGMQTARYSINRRTLDVGRMSLRGPYSDDYQHLTQVPIETAPFSACDGRESLRIDTSIQVAKTGRNGGEALLTVDSIDGELKHHYGIVWRRCGGTPQLPGSDEVAVRDISRGRTLGAGADGATYAVENFGGACWKATRNGTPITPCEHGFAFFLGGRFIAATRGASGKLYHLDGTRASPTQTFHSVKCNLQRGSTFDCQAKVGARVSSFSMTYR